MLHILTSAVITQCSIRHLYSLSPSEFPHKDASIDLAKTFERRRCNHHELPEPLLEKECIESVVIHNGGNKHRYCVATQSSEIRQLLRAVPGVPLVYINRSVMIMEPMAPISAMKREREEMGKFRLGIKDARPKPAGAKRKRVEGEESGGEGAEGEKDGVEKKKKKRKGPKGPNPLSVKKKKKPEKPKGGESAGAVKSEEGGGREGEEAKEGGGDVPAKKKRRRKHGAKKSSGEDGNTGGSSVAAEVIS